MKEATQANSEDCKLIQEAGFNVTLSECPNVMPLKQQAHYAYNYIQGKLCLK